jgi:hypothetical protein
MEIYAAGLVVIIALIWLALHLSKGAGRQEAELEEAKKRIKGAEARHEKELDFKDLTRDSIIKRGAKWMRKK